MRNNSTLKFVFTFWVSALIGSVITLFYMSAGPNLHHHSTMMKLKNHHIVMRDDTGKWFEYVLNNGDYFNIPSTTLGNFKVPVGGAWKSIEEPEENEIEESEDISIDESADGEPDAAAGTEMDSGSSGGDSSSSDGGGDDGGDD